MDISKLTKIKIAPKLTPRAYFEIENAHMVNLGLKNPCGGIGLKVEGIYEGRLYFENKDILKSVMSDLKKLDVVTIIECALTRIVIYKREQASILRYYLKGRNIDCQGV